MSPPSQVVAVVHTYGALVIRCCLFYAVYSALPVVLTSDMSLRFPPGTQGMAYGVVLVGSVVGLGLGGVVAGNFGNNWRTAAYIFGAVCALPALAFFVVPGLNFGLVSAVNQFKPATGAPRLLPPPAVRRLLLALL